MFDEIKLEHSKIITIKINQIKFNQFEYLKIQAANFDEIIDAIVKKFKQSCRMKLNMNI